MWHHSWETAKKTLIKLHLGVIKELHANMCKELRVVPARWFLGSWVGMSSAGCQAHAGSSSETPGGWWWHTLKKPLPQIYSLSSEYQDWDVPKKNTLSYTSTMRFYGKRLSVDLNITRLCCMESWVPFPAGWFVLQQLQERLMKNEKNVLAISAAIFHSVVLKPFVFLTSRGQWLREMDVTTCAHLEKERRSGFRLVSSSMGKQRN